MTHTQTVLLCIAFGAFALVYVVNRLSAVAKKSRLKKCPHCNEYVPRTARVCSHCHSPLPRDES